MNHENTASSEPSSNKLIERQKLAIYNLLLTLFSPLFLLKKAIKFGRRGHYHEWDAKRWMPPIPLPAATGKRLVFVVLSQGEVPMIARLTTELQQLEPSLDIVWSIRDAVAQENARKAHPNRSVVSMPLDFSWPAAQWLRAVKPDVLVVVEKFWWPNLVWGAHLAGARVVLINGRSRESDRARYRLMKSFRRWIMRGFDVLCFDSEEQLGRVRAALPAAVKAYVTGNVKFSLDSIPTPKNAQALGAWLYSRPQTAEQPVPLLIAGSTSSADDEFALTAFAQLRKEKPCALLLAPRRIERAGEVAATAQARGFSVSLRSTVDENAGQAAPADVYVLDTLGELAYAYQFGVAAYVGGALEGRGHNILEPLIWGVPVSYGPNRGDFEAAQRAAEEFKVGFRLRTSEELARHWLQALTDDELHRHVREASRRLLQQEKDALQRTLEVLQTVLRGEEKATSVEEAAVKQT